MKVKKIIFTGLALSSLLLSACQSTTPPAENSQPVTTQPQSNPADTAKIEQLQNELTKTKEDLVEAKVRFEVKSYWDVHNIYKNPSNPEQFIFLRDTINQGIADVDVGIYDLKKDSNYQKTGHPDVANNNTSIYREKLAKDMVLYDAGMDGSKFVLWETGMDNSPGPCFNTWQGDNLTFIDINDTKPVRKPYQISAEKKQESEKMQAECEKDMRGES